jgi:hypothetical protein
MRSACAGKEKGFGVNEAYTSTESGIRRREGGLTRREELAQKRKEAMDEKRSSKAGSATRFTQHQPDSCRP